VSTSWTHGAVRFPLPTGTGNTLLQDADPTVFYLLDFFTWCFRQYLGARLLEAAAGAELAGITDAVLGQGSFDPYPHLQETQMPFPMLAVYRTTSDFVDRTVSKRQDTSTLILAYVLPPMAGSQLEQVGPILHAAKGLVNRKCVERQDDAYTPPGAAKGDSVATLASLVDLDCVKADFGAWQAPKDLYFPAIVCTLSAIEASAEDLSGLLPFEGANVGIDLRTAQGDTPDLGSVNIDMPLRVTAVSPTSGPRAGATSVTLTTQNAKPGTKVYFGDALADVWGMAGDGTSISVRAPAMAAHLPNNYPASVTIVGPDTQADRLPAAYTYVA
jgi:hypothetical protein